MMKRLCVCLALLGYFTGLFKTGRKHNFKIKNILFYVTTNEAKFGPFTKMLFCICESRLDNHRLTSQIRI